MQTPMSKSLLAPFGAPQDNRSLWLSISKRAVGGKGDNLQLKCMAPETGWTAYRARVIQCPPAARSLVLKLIPVSNSKVLLLLKSMDKDNEEVLVVE